MVHIKDDGVFDEPIDKIWKYLQDDSPSVHVHTAIKGAKTLEEQGAAVTQEMEFLNPDGRTTRKETWKFVFDPPKGFSMESLAGASKGTKYTHRYTPQGNRTRVEVDGDFRFQGMDDSQTRQAALGFLGLVFDEDSKNLKRYK